ncbi:MAG: thioredoxin family protein [Chitinispirillia bacterium]|jgi:glutaredoxin
MVDYKRFVETAHLVNSYLPPLKMVKYPDKNETEFSSKLFEIADILDNSSGKGIQCTTNREMVRIGKPSLTLVHPGSGEIHYMAVPEQNEIEPFIDVIINRIQNKSSLSPDLIRSLSQISKPAHIAVNITSSCPHCQHAVRAANSLALQCEKISVSIYDIEQFPENAEKYSIKSVPLTVIDHRHIINNTVSEKVLAQYILDRGTEENERTVFLSQINTGNIDLTLKSIVDKAQNLKQFIYAWKNSTLSLRMGLFLLAEKVIDHDRELFYIIIADLIDILSSQDIALRGDTVDLLSQIGHKDAIEPIKKLLNDPNPDIVELAKDALEELN